METRIEIDIPENVTANITESTVIITGEKGTLQRKLWYPGVDITQTGTTIIVETQKNRKKQAAIVGTFASHIKNMIKGVTEGYTYKMKVVFSHFPIQIKVENNNVSIANFLGEKQARKAKIYDDVKVIAKSDEVTVSGINKEHVGQTAANIEQATKIRRFDPRVFQDGIYVVGKT